MLFGLRASASAVENKILPVTKSTLMGTTSLTRPENFFKQVIKLSQPFWASKASSHARLLAGAVTLAILARVGLSYENNHLIGALTNAFNSRNEIGTAVALAEMAVCGVLLNRISATGWKMTEGIKLDWRHHRTQQMMAESMENQAHAYLKATANPDQCISENAGKFSDQIVGTAFSFLESMLTSLSFGGVLFQLSKNFNLQAGGHHFYIPGLMVWAGVLSAGLGSWQARRTGQPQIKLNETQQKTEADLRQALVKNLEPDNSMAIQSDVKHETETLDGLLNKVVINRQNTIQAVSKFLFFRDNYNTAAGIIPYAVASPFYFANKISMGSIFQSVDAFQRLQGGLSFFINAYTGLADLKATTNRLTAFENAVAQSRQSAEGTPAAIENIHEPDIEKNLLPINEKAPITPSWQMTPAA